MFVSLGLRVYIHFAESYTITNGSLGAVIVLLLWFYVGGVAVLTEGVVNGVLETLRVNQGNPARRQSHDCPSVPRSCQRSRGNSG